MNIDSLPTIGVEFTDALVVAATAVVAVIISALSLLAFRTQSRLATLQVLSSQEERWNTSEDLRHFRHASAEWWLDNKRGHTTEVMDLTPETVEVLDFLNVCSSLAALHPHSRFARKATWYWMGDAIQQYWNAYKLDIEHMRVASGQPVALRELEYMDGVVWESEVKMSHKYPDTDPLLPWDSEQVERSMMRERLYQPPDRHNPVESYRRISERYLRHHLPARH